MTFPFPFVPPSSTSTGNDANTKLLLHLNGSDGSTTFTDTAAGAGAAHNGTAIGSAQIDVDQSKFGGSSALISGGSAGIVVADHADFDFGTGDLTVDLQFRPSSLGTQYLYDWRAAGAGAPAFYFLLDSAGAASVLIGGATMTCASGTFATGAWHHVAVVRASGTVYVFVEGVQKDSDTGSGTINLSSHGMHFGCRESSDTGISGWVQEIRVSNIARWTAGFTPPTAAYS